MLRLKRSRMLLASLGVCLFAAGPLAAAEFHAVLNGAKEPTGGNPEAWGRVKLHVNDSTKRLCADVETRSTGKITGIYIFRGVPGDKSEPVVKIQTPKDNDAEDCDTIGGALADEIQANPTSFYVGVQTAQFPMGAIAGQLQPGGYKG